jgi:hypothetical protein
MKAKSLISIIKFLPKAFLASFVLFLLLQWLLSNSGWLWKIGELYNRPYDDYPFRYESQLQRIPSSHTKRSQVVIVGSSSTQNAFDAQYLNSVYQHNGFDFYKVSLPFFYPTDLYQQRKTLLDVKPDILIIESHPSQFYIPDGGLAIWGGEAPYDFIWEFIFEPSVMFYVKKHLGAHELFDRAEVYKVGIINRMFFLNRHRKTLRYFVKTAFSDFLNKTPRQPQEYHHFDPKSEKYYQEMMYKFKNKDMYQKGELLALNQELFVIFARFMVEEDVEVIAIDLPRNPLLGKMYDRSLDSDHELFMRQQASDIGFTYISRREMPVFKSVDFLDLVHMNDVGRDRMSKFLKQYINDTFIKGK